MFYGANSHLVPGVIISAWKLTSKHNSQERWYRMFQAGASGDVAYIQLSEPHIPAGCTAVSSAVPQLQRGRCRLCAPRLHCAGQQHRVQPRSVPGRCAGDLSAAGLRGCGTGDLQRAQPAAAMTHYSNTMPDILQHCGMCRKNCSASRDDITKQVLTWGMWWSYWGGPYSFETRTQHENSMCRLCWHVFYECD